MRSDGGELVSFNEALTGKHPLRPAETTYLTLSVLIQRCHFSDLVGNTRGHILSNRELGGYHRSRGMQRGRERECGSFEKLGAL